MNKNEVLALTQKWLSGFVIKLGLCPFAALPYQQGRIRITSLEGETTIEAILNKMTEEARRLLAYDEIQLETTLVVIPNGLEDFMVYLEMSEEIETKFAQLGYEGILQVATFHPDYRFADSLPEDAADYTNRSPFPMFHILRENSITEAVDTYPDIDNIPEKNKILLRKMGKDDVLIWLDNLYKNEKL